MASRKLPIIVVAGVGGGGGTGGATARLFAKNGYRVAVLARNADQLKAFAESIKADGGEAAPFPVEAYTHDSMKATFSSIKQAWPDSEIRAALWNAGAGVFKNFLDVTEDDIKQSLDTNVVGAFAFARETILAFKEAEPNDIGKRGTLIFTGATAAIRGNTWTSAFAAGKHGLRALSQSLAKEFGKENIHVAHSIIDGAIGTDRAPKEKAADPNQSLNPNSIAKAYLNLANQDSSAFTWELDLRPAHEKVLLDNHFQLFTTSTYLPAHFSPSVMPRANLDYELLETILADLSHLSVHPNRLVPVGCSTVTGGYGIVTVAKLHGVMDPATRSDFLVAVKTLRPVGNRHERSLTAFSLARELKVWQRLEHPNILYLFGFYLNEDKTEAQLISPYIKFGHIEEYIRDENPDLAKCVDLIFFQTMPYARYIKEPQIFIAISKGVLPAKVETLDPVPFESLRWILDQCWQLDPEFRPSARDIILALNQASGQLRSAWSSADTTPRLGGSSLLQQSGSFSLPGSPDPEPGAIRGVLTFTQFDALQQPRECQIHTLVRCPIDDFPFPVPWPTVLNIRPINYQPIPDAGVASLFPSGNWPVFAVEVDSQYHLLDPYDPTTDTGPIHFRELWETLARNSIPPLQPVSDWPW
ncbi:hypothetical protein FRC04_010120 [Tulasnella sp. 424]|nr:hypothetical protein FRC04_010120 [Tulasnella sp. 424]